MPDKLTNEEQEAVVSVSTVEPTVQDRPRLCEEGRGHLPKVKIWPPKMRHGSSRRTPSTPGVCTRCGCHVIIYDPIQAGLTIILPDGKRLTGGDIAGATKPS